MNGNSEEFDFVIVGSGAGAMAAALVIKQQGGKPLVIEKQDKVGGSTAYSGGVAWIPNNDHVKAAGAEDSHDKSMTYLNAVIGDVGPASSPAKREMFVRHGIEMVRFLESFGMKFMHAAWPDYYSSKPGGLAEGRSLVSPLFDINELGDWADKLASYAGWPPLPISSHEGAALSCVKRTWAGKRLALKVACRMLYQFITRKRLRGSGNAMQGRMLQILLRENLPIWIGTGVREFVVEGKRVVGVVAEQGGREITVRARKGVLINAGGFSHNPDMREKYQPSPASTKWTVANPGDTGEMIEAAQRLGAAVDLMNEAWWVPGSFFPDGKIAGFHVPSDAGKPHCIIVNKEGLRFGNEAGAYMEFGQRMYACGAVPAWAILDRRNRERYTWGMYGPGKVPDEWIRSGYMKTSDSLEDLARQCGIDPAGLRDTVARFNGFCATGVDEDWMRGESAYNKYYGDPTHTPNASLGVIEKAPFYAVAIYPSDVGTSGGIMTDEYARVLRTDGSVIEGLYATGNCTASVMGRSYVGAGASIGASYTFGYVAARHACGLET